MSTGKYRLTPVGDENRRVSGPWIGSATNIVAIQSGGRQKDAFGAKAREMKN